MSLGKIVAIIVAVISCIIAPLLFFTQQNDNVVQTVVYSRTVDFVEDIREQGKLTQEMYNMFIRDLDATGMLYDIKIEHEHKTVVPVFNEDGSVKGTKDITEMTYEDDILKQVFTDVEHTSGDSIIMEAGVYEFTKGDTITVTVISRENTTSAKIYGSLLNNSGISEKIYATYGGVIRDENY